jgi:hypothetical protein
MLIYHKTKLLLTLRRLQDYCLYRLLVKFIFTRLDDRRTFILLGNTLKFRYQFQFIFQLGMSHVKYFANT